MPNDRKHGLHWRDGKPRVARFTVIAVALSVTFVSAFALAGLAGAGTAQKAGAAAAAATTTTTATTTSSTTTTTAPTGCTTSGGTVAIAGITSPAHLVIDQFQVTPSTVLYSTRSLTARFHVSACGGSVQGALVYVTAVPYGMFAATNEQATGSDGWATLNFTARAGFPVSQKQQLLVMFVRARKSGEDLLGGISARRLVSFKVARG